MASRDTTNSRASEVKLQRKLTPSSSTGRSNLSEGGQVVDIGSAGSTKDMPVEGVKHLEPKFNVHLFLNVGALHDPKVLVIAWESSYVEQTWGIPVGERRGCLKGIDV